MGCTARAHTHGFATHEARATHSLFRQQQIDRPTSPNVRPWPAQVFEDRGIGAAGVFKGVGEDGEMAGFEGASGHTTIATRLAVNRPGEKVISFRGVA